MIVCSISWLEAVEGVKIKERTIAMVRSKIKFAKKVGAEYALTDVGYNKIKREGAIANGHGFTDSSVAFDASAIGSL